MLNSVANFTLNAWNEMGMAWFKHNKFMLKMFSVSEEGLPFILLYRDT